MAAKFGRFVLLLAIALVIAIFLSLRQDWTTATGALRHIGVPESRSSQGSQTQLVSVPRPRRDFTAFAKYPPQNIKDESRNVFATFLCTKGSDPREISFVATQSLVWRFLWSEWHSKYSFVVFVCPSVPTRERNILLGQGAIVKEVGYITGLKKDEHIPESLKDQYSIINIWKSSEYRKIGFVNVTAFPIRNIDDIFDKVPVQQCMVDRLSSEDSKAMMQVDKPAATEFCAYTLGAVDHHGAGGLNGDVLVLAPNLLLHQKLVRDAARTDKYEVGRGLQGLFDSRITFHTDGPFPAHHLGEIYNAVGQFYIDNRLSSGEKAIRVVQDKLWDPEVVKDKKELGELWDQDWMQLCRFYDNYLFANARVTGIYKTEKEQYMEDIDPNKNPKLRKKMKKPENKGKKA